MNLTLDVNSTIPCITKPSSTFASALLALVFFTFSSLLLVYFIGFCEYGFLSECLFAFVFGVCGCVWLISLMSLFPVADEEKARRQERRDTEAAADAEEDGMSHASREAVDGEVGGVYRQDYLEGEGGGTERLI